MPRRRGSDFGIGTQTHDRDQMHSQSYKLRSRDAFKTALERFEQSKKEGATSEFSEINLHAAVLDDTEKKETSVQPVRLTTISTPRLSLREMLKHGKFKSPSTAILAKTVRQIKDEQNARKRALLERLKMKTKARIKLNKITRFMQNAALEEKERKAKERRLEMGLPQDLKIKSVLAQIRVTDAFKTPATPATPAIAEKEKVKTETVKLPKIPKANIEKQKRELQSVHNGMRLCSTYGGFLWDEVGHSECKLKLPSIRSDHVEILGSIPTRPAYFNFEKEKRAVKFPSHLEKFRLTRIKN